MPKERVAVATEAALGVLPADPAIFDFGGQVALVDGETLVLLDEHALGYYLAGSIQFWPYRKVGGEPIEVDIDPPTKLVRQILSLGPRRQLTPLPAIVTAPTIRPDGVVLSAPGYDPQISLLVWLENTAHVATAPAPGDVEQALVDLMHPFTGIPFVDEFARGGLLAALLSAVLRPTLETAPAFGIDAPIQGSGKTLLASCIAAPATGLAPDIWPHTASREDEESRELIASDGAPNRTVRG